MSRSLIIGIVITILLISGLAVLFYYLYIKENEKSVFDAIPNDAAFVIETNSAAVAWSSFSHATFWNDMIKNENIQKLTSQINFLDSLLNTDTELSNILAGQKFAVSFHPSMDLQLLFVAQTGSLPDLKRVLSALVIRQGKTISKRKFENETI